MRYVERTAVPPSKYLSSPQARSARLGFLNFLRLAERQRAQTKVPDRHLPDDRSLADALAELFNGKCAFCESRVPTLIYRFRPTSDAEPRASADPMAHVAYGWLADAWQNLYPICRECFPSRPNYFPVDGARLPTPTSKTYEAYVAANDGIWPGYPLPERAMLLDPCVAWPEEDGLIPDLSGVLSAQTQVGDETIRHFNLNRPELIERRAAAFRRYGNARLRGPVDNLEFIGLWHILHLRRVPGRREPPTRGRVPRTRVKAETLPPRLRQIAIKNFKSLEDMQITLPEHAATEELAQALLILGENASGKSSILEATTLALLDDASRDSLRIDPREQLLNPEYLGAERTASRTESSMIVSQAVV